VDDIKSKIRPPPPPPPPVLKLFKYNTRGDPASLRAASSFGAGRCSSWPSCRFFSLAVPLIFVLLGQAGFFGPALAAVAVVEEGGVLTVNFESCRDAA